MHVLFAHKNYPAQFRYIIPYLVSTHGIRCSFVTSNAAVAFADVTECEAVERIPYAPRASASSATSYCGRTHENQMWESQAIVEALAAREDLRPDLIVAHSGFFTTSFLREMYDCPIVNLFEYFYHTTNSECDFRSDLFEQELIRRVRTRARNANFLLDLANCDRGYCPTEWQKSRFPAEFQDKLSVIHDGVDTHYWTPFADRFAADTTLGIPAFAKVVTYVARGFESLRGFDIFMKVAKRICDMRDDVVFLIAGGEQSFYGPDRRITNGVSFKNWVLQQDDYDLQRIRFVGHLPKSTVRSMYRRSDLHIYLTAPFILSWSPLDAMSCQCLVLGSDTGPVREVIQHGGNGLLCDFFDIDAMVETATQALDNPFRYSPMRVAARDTILSRFSMDVCLPKLTKMFEDVLAASC